MSPELYNNLTFVRGFTNANGDTYQKHITLILEKHLNNEQREEILATTNIENALNLLTKYGIDYNHDFSGLDPPP